MPEADFVQLTAGLRRAARALDAAQELLGRSAQEHEFWARIERLAALPRCVEFHPFAASSAWSVPLAPPGVVQAPPPASRRAELVLSAQDARGAPLPSTLPAGGARSVRATPLAPRPSSAGSSPISELERAMRPAASLSGAGEAERREPAGITRLRELLARVERSATAPALGGAPAHRAAQQAGGDSRAPSAARGGSAARAAFGDAGAFSAEESASAAPPSRARAAGQSAPASSLSLLEQYVAALETRAAGRRANVAASTAVTSGSPETAPLAAGPAPRAASLLLAASAPAAALHGAAAVAAQHAGPTAAHALPELAAATTDDDATDDALAERLNRVLLEQAWLRGVDLT